MSSLASHEKYQVEEVSPANSALQPFPVGDFHIPCNWDSENHTPRNIQPYTLVKLSEKCWEYASIEGEFSKAGGKILRIDRIENKELWEKFHAESKRMLRTRTAVNEVYLFHGSKGKKDDICQEGLDQRLSRIGHFGRGIYFSNDVRKCFFYTKERGKDKPSEDQQCTVYKCRVLLGIVKMYPKGQNAKDLKREPQLDKPGPLGIKYYDSVQGQISEFEEFIVYKSERVLPEYIITCVPPKSSSSAPLQRNQSLPAFINNVQSSSASSAPTTNGHSNSAPSSPTNSVEFDEEEAWELQYLSASNEQPSRSADETKSSTATGGVKEERSASVGSAEEVKEERCDSASEEDPFESPQEEMCESAGEEDEDLYSPDSSLTTNNHPNVSSKVPDQDDSSSSVAAAAPMFQSDEDFQRHLLEVRKRVQEKRRKDKENPSHSSANSEPSHPPPSTNQQNLKDPESTLLDDEHHRRLVEVRKRMQEKRRREKLGLPTESDEEEASTDDTTTPAVDEDPDDNVRQAIDSLVPQFLEFTGCDDIEEATRYIKHAQMDLNDAIMMYLNAT